MLFRAQASASSLMQPAPTRTAVGKDQLANGSVDLVINSTIVKGACSRCLIGEASGAHQQSPLVSRHMEALSVTQAIGDKALIAVVEVDDARLAAELARCLSDSGVPAIEITLRTAGALPSLEAAANVDGIVVGAGTVLTSDDAEQCKDAGAQFAVSPVFDEQVAARCLALDMPFVPGAVTPTEVLRVLDAGLAEVKLFPAEPFGGLALVRSLAAVFPKARFMPTGGIDQQAAVDYLAHPAVAAVGGSWIAPAALIRNQEWDLIRQQARSAMAALDTGAPR